ncbi:MAG: hypothetical protein ACSLE1_14355 [Sphingobium sp.]
MARLLSRFVHREGYKVHVDPDAIRREERDEYGPVLTLRDGTVLKLTHRRPGAATNIVALRSHREAVLACT